jgi:hypothetical protein
MAMAGDMNGSGFTAKFAMEAKGEVSKRGEAGAVARGIGNEAFVVLGEGRGESPRQERERLTSLPARGRAASLLSLRRATQGRPWQGS